MFCFYNGLVGGALISLAGYQIGIWQTAGGGASDADGAHSPPPQTRAMPREMLSRGGPLTQMVHNLPFFSSDFEVFYEWASLCLTDSYLLPNVVLKLNLSQLTQKKLRRRWTKKTEKKLTNVNLVCMYVGRKSEMSVFFLFFSQQK